eukprot:2540874-Prymnesium_polylepis.1
MIHDPFVTPASPGGANSSVAFSSSVSCGSNGRSSVPPACDWTATGTTGAQRCSSAGGVRKAPCATSAHPMKTTRSPVMASAFVGWPSKITPIKEAKRISSVEMIAAVLARTNLTPRMKASCASVIDVQ